MLVLSWAARDGLLAAQPVYIPPSGPEARAAEIEKEAMAVEAECGNPMYASFHNCPCVAEKFRAARAALPAEVEAKIKAASAKEFSESAKSIAFAKIEDQVDAQCMNAPGIVAHANEVCTAFDKISRTDYLEFCQCVATTLAHDYAQKPSYNLALIERMTTNARLQCGAGKPAVAPKAAKPTELEASREKRDVEEACTNNPQQRSYVNCGCLAEKVAAQRALSTEKSWQNLVLDVASQCPADKGTIAGYLFTSCDAYYQTIRTDHESFCHCSASKAADGYVAKPNFNLRYMENLRRVAMQECGIADNSHRIR